MKKILFITVMIMMWLLGSQARAGTSVLVNGSFEDDGVIDDITISPPNGWDPNFPDPNKFVGYVDTDWPTDANYSLTLYSERWVTFEANDMATVSQEVYLTDVNEIVFDVNLDTYAFSSWDPSKITPVLLIDNEVVWDLIGAGSDVRGEYFDVTYVVDEVYQDADLHKLSLGLRVNVSEMLTDYYMADWDYIEFKIYCDDYGLIPGDIDRDCYVDANDLSMLVDVWLKEMGQKSRYNLYRVDDPNGIVNFPDYSILADNWQCSSYD